MTETESIVFLLGALDPDHIVEQQFLRVRRRKPRVLKAGTMHYDLAQRPDLGVDAERQCTLKLLGHLVSPFLRS